MRQLKKIHSAMAKGYERFLYSYGYILLITAIGVIGFFTRQEREAIFLIAMMVSIQWVLVKDVLPSLIALMIIGMVPLARNEVDYFMPLFWALTYTVPAWLLHWIIYPPKRQIGRFFLPTLTVAIAITLGGLFSPYYLNNFQGASLYYVIALGIGMVMIYLVVENDLPYRKDATDYFAKMMIGVGIMGIAMVVSYYFHHWETIVGSGPDRYFQWRNNLSNNLLLSMPFAFYLAAKAKFPLVYYLLGTVQFIILVVSFSRGGMIFGTLVFPLLVATLFIVRPKWSLAFIVILGGVFTGLYFFAETYFAGFEATVASMIERVQISPDEARANLLRRAFENLRNYPLFGTGFGYTTAPYYNPKPMSMYWYHTTIGQVVGSLGIVGIVAYTFQAIVRTVTLIEKRILFNLFVAFSILGFGGYSMVNVGYFIPLPMVAVLTQMFILVERNNRYN